MRTEKQLKQRREAAKRYAEKNRHPCRDCPKIIGRISKRCSKCHLKKFSTKSKTHRENIAKTKLSEKNPQWKGDSVGYHALHNWIKKRKPKSEFCENCKIKPPIDLANISQKYQRDVNDFEWLCRKCHINKDGRIKNLKNN